MKNKLLFIYLCKDNEKCNISNENIFVVKNVKDLNKIKKFDCEYITFYKNTTKYRNVNFDKIINYMSTNSISLYALNPYDSNNKTVLPFKKDTLHYTKDGKFNLFFDCYIYSKKFFDNYIFNDDYETDFIINCLDLEKQYFQSSNEIAIKYEDISKDKNTFNKQFSERWYIDELKNIYLKNIVNASIDKQNMYLNLYILKLIPNIRQINSSIFTPKKYSQFIKLSKELLNNIDDTLLNTSNITSSIDVPKNIIYYLLRLKYGNNIKYREVGNSIYYKEFVDNIESNKIYIDAINYNEGKLHFYCNYDLTSYNVSKFKIYVNSKEIDYNLNNIYSDVKIFGEKYYSSCSFDFYVDLKQAMSINFKTSYGEKIEMLFQLPASRLTSNYSKSYWNIKDYVIKYNDGSLLISKKNGLITLKNEILFSFQILKRNKLNKKSIESVIFRLLHFLSKPFYSRKNIWITYDKLYKGGDCGEYFFRYVAENTNQTIYYIVNKNTAAYKNLKSKYNNILPFGTFKCMLICSHATEIFATDAQAISFCGFGPFMSKICRNIFNANINCIQHGLTMQEIPHVQNVIHDNIKYYFLASKYEKKNILQPKYGYKEENTILTGIPRFDGLINNPSKIILITPTWRVDVASSSYSGKIRKYNNNFKQTTYFKVYNELINNKKLLNEASKYGYKFIFIIHPTLVSNIADYETNSYVKIVAADKIDYEDMLIKSEIMITDYSGIQYDFAYMRKPIVYYHNEELPPSYDNGMMDYKKIGFGDVVKTEEGLIESIIKIMKNNGKIEKKYLLRCNNFFEYSDFNSSERIYKFIKSKEKGRK